MISARNFLLLGFVFFLPLYPKVSTLVLVVLSILSIIILIKKKEKTIIKPYLVPCLIFMTLIMSFFYSKNFEPRYIEQRASLIAIPLIFLTVKLDNNLYQKILKYFVNGCFIAVVICYANALYTAFSIVDGTVVFRPVVNDEFSFFYSVVRDGNYFFSDFFSIIHDTIYFSIFINMAIAIILVFALWKINKLYFLLLLVFSLVIFQLSSKIGMITFFCILLLYLLYSIKKNILKFSLCVFILISGLLFFASNPRGQSMLEKFNKEGLTINPAERFGYSLRLMSWDASIDLIREHLLLGVGIADAQEKLNEKYIEKSYKTAFENRFNSHNQFLQIYLEGGAIALILLMLMIFQIFKTINFNREVLFLNSSFFVIMIISFLFESVFNRYSGISFFVFFYNLFINRSINKID